MRIATLVPSLTRGGAEKVASVLANGLSEKYDHDLIVFWRREQEYETRSNILSLEIPSQFDNKGLVKRIIKIRGRVNALNKLLLDNNYDVVISHLFNANLVNAYSNAKIKIGVIHGSASLYNSTLTKLVANNYYKNLDMVVGVSKFYQQHFQKTFSFPEEKVKTVYNPIEIDLILSKAQQPLPSEFEYLKNKRFILQMGSLSKPKGNWHAIRAFKKVLEYDKDLILVLLGQAKNHYGEYLNTLVKELGLESNIVFAGHHNNPYPFVKIATLFLMSSIREGLPMAMIESMAVGAPVMSTHCISGPLEILSNQSDYSVEINDLFLGEFGALIPKCDGKEYSKIIENLSK
jgi:glycosyltransferase involved in cell wall biosynthesis